MWNRGWLLVLWVVAGVGVWPAAADDRADDVLPGLVVVMFEADAGPIGPGAKTGLAGFDARAEVHGAYAVERAFPFLEAEAAKRPLAASMDALRRVYLVRYAGPQRPHRVAEDLAGAPHVEFAEPYYVRRLHHERVAAPNDTRYPDMVHLTRLELEAAWDVVKGEDGDVVIAIIDGGTDYRHPDLLANIWTNPGEIEDDGVDNDGNGFIDDYRGWNFSTFQGGAPGQNGTPDPSAPGQPSNIRHGTAVAGTAGAVTDNNAGIAGASWNATIMPINAGCPNNDNAICFGYTGLLYAALNGADIANASWGGSVASELEERVVNAVFDEGTLIVASAGNAGTDADRFPSYPGSYDRVLGAGATEKDADFLRNSNYGRSVDVFAPGRSIDVTIPGGQYGLFSGTSFSSPLTAGVAALVKTRFPEMTPDQVREQIRVTADNIDASNPPFVGRLGRGRVNAFRAVTETGSPALRVDSVAVSDSDGDRKIESGDVVTLDLRFRNFLADAGAITVTLGSDDEFVEPVDATATLPPVASGETATATVSFRVAAGTPPSRLLVVYVELDDGAGYTDAAVLRLTANETSFVSHRTDVLQVSVTDEGNIGYLGFQGDSPGTGFVWNDNSVLFEGGLLIATGPDKVSDSVRGVSTAQDQNEDFVLKEGSTLQIFSPGQFTTEQGEVTLTDASAPSPIGVSVLQTSYIDDTPAHDDFVILHYTITNDTDAPIENLFAGLFFDWDVNQIDPSADFARYDDELEFGYIADGAQPSLLAGAYLLTPEAGRSYRAIDNPTQIYRDQIGGGFTEEEKWTFLSAGVRQKTLSRSDVSQLVGAGPYRIDPGASVEVAFAVIGGGSEADLLESARAAQMLWDGLPTPIDEPAPLPEGFALGAVYPNPFRAAATVPFSLGEPATVTLEIYDVLGRHVATLAAGRRGTGRHTASWDGRDRAGRPAAAGVYFVRLRADGATRSFHGVRRALLVR